MARIRTIKPAFFTSEQVVSCSPLARLLFIGLWCEADRAGRLEDKPGQLRMRLLPGDNADVDALLWELHDAKLISRVECSSGLAAIVIPEFDTHQRPHPKEPASLIPNESREKTRPAVIGREKVVMLPGEFPSSPVGMDKESRKGREGDLGMEKRGGLGGGLVTSPMDFEKLQRFNAYIGVRLRIPHKLHRDFVALLGGDDPESVLRAWYAEVDAELEQTRAAIAPDIWKFMEARFKVFAADRATADAWAAYDAKHGITGATDGRA